MAELSRTEQTEDSYRSRAARDLIPRIATHAGKPASLLTPDDAVLWLEFVKPNYTPNSFRQYRNALAFYFETMGVSADRVRLTKQNGLCVPPKKGATSSRKQKKIPIKRAVRLITALQDTGRKWSLFAADLFAGSLIAGLRPIEWETARLDGDILIIQNAKATNGRGNGKERLIRLDDGGIPIVARVIDAIARFDPLINWLACARAAFYETRIKLYPKSQYSLYTGRHQFSANMKALFGREVVAGMMGHKSIRTAAIHYGKRRSAWKKNPETTGVTPITITERV